MTYNDSDEYPVDAFISKCNTFNRVAGKDSLVSRKDFFFQQELIEEEVQEGFTAVQDNNVTEILDACIDTLVTTFGQLQKLEHLGVDVYKAMHLTALNNISKFVHTEEEAIATSDMYLEQGIQTTVEYNTDYEVFIIKDATSGKILKPIGFVRNDISSCVPEDLQTKGLK